SRVSSADLVGTPDAGAAEREQAREVLAFTFATPAYRAVLDHHGLGAVADELHALAGRGDCSALAARVSDAMLDRFVPTGSFEEIPDVLRRRYEGLVDG